MLHNVREDIQSGVQSENSHPCQLWAHVLPLECRRYACSPGGSWIYYWHFAAKCRTKRHCPRVWRSNSRNVSNTFFQYIIENFRYNADELKWPRIVHVTKSDKANIVFWRKKSGSEAVLELRWRVLSLSNPNIVSQLIIGVFTVYTEPLKSIPLTTEPTTVASPFYPANHDNFLNLTYRFFAPKE